MQTNDLPRIGVLSADPAAVTQFLRRVQALGADPTALLPLSPAAVPDCEPYLCGTSTQSPLPKLRAAAEVLAASGCTVIAAPDSAGVFCEEITAAVGIPTLGVSGPALQQLVGKLRQRASVLCTPGVRAANGYGITLDELAAKYGADSVDALKEAYRPRLENMIRQNLMCQALAQDAGITVDQDAVDEYFAQQGVNDCTALMKSYGKGYIYQGVRTELVAQYLMEHVAAE